MVTDFYHCTYRTLKNEKDKSSKRGKYIKQCDFTVTSLFHKHFEEEERSNVMKKLEAQRQGHLRSKENVSHIQSIQRDANSN